MAGCGPVNIRPLTCETDSVTICSEVVDSATITNIPSSAVTVVAKAANTLRKGLILFNDSSSTVYVSYAATSSSTLFTHKLIGNESLELPQPVYTGVISVIWDSAVGSLMVTEVF